MVHSRSRSPTGSRRSTATDPEKILWHEINKDHVRKMKAIDQRVALSIGAMGGVPTRDKRGNVLDALWVKYSERSVVGMLLETNDIRKILLEQINEQIKARRDLIQEVEETDIVCKWLIDFTSSWETAYSKSIITRFDIGQLILSVMSEAYFEVLDLFRESHKMKGRSTQRWFLSCVKDANVYFDEQKEVAKLETALAKKKKENTTKKYKDIIEENKTQARNTSTPLFTQSEIKNLMEEAEANIANSDTEIKQRVDMLNVSTHTGDDAVVRLLFRHPNTQGVMCRIAGAMLRKQVRADVRVDSPVCDTVHVR